VATDSVFIQRICIRNYKSIAACDVALKPLTFLVGPNGAGKSNFLDALRFTAESLRFTLDHALRERGGIQEVRRRSGGHPNHFGIRLDFTLPGGANGHYAFQIAARQPGGFEVQTEECATVVPSTPPARVGFRVDRGVVRDLDSAPAASSDGLYLAAVAGRDEFRPLYEALSRMRFYRPDPEKIRDLEAPDTGDLLAYDSGNVTSLLRRMATHDAAAKRRVEEYLSRIVPGVEGVDVRAVGAKETLEFRQEMAGAEHAWRFLASSMSNGTLHALGALAALFQPSARGSLTAIDGPMAALDLAAAVAMTEALQEASERTQVLATAHGLPDVAGVEDDSILGVQAIGGITEVGRSATPRGRLSSAGEVLGLNQSRVDTEPAGRRDDSQLQLFDQQEG